MSKRLYKVVSATGVMNFVNVDHIIRIHETAEKKGTRIILASPDSAIVVKKLVTEVAAEIEKLL